MDDHDDRTRANKFHDLACDLSRALDRLSPEVRLRVPATVCALIDAMDALVDAEETLDDAVRAGNDAAYGTSTGFGSSSHAPAEMRLAAAHWRTAAEMADDLDQPARAAGLRAQAVEADTEAVELEAEDAA